MFVQSALEAHQAVGVEQLDIVAKHTQPTARGR